MSASHLHNRYLDTPKVVVAGAVPAVDSERVAWGQLLLPLIGRPVDVNNLVTLVAWETAEGGGFGNIAANNPLNCTLPVAGSWSINGVDVQAYPTAPAGLEATASTLRNGYYPMILAGLATSSSPEAMANIIGSEPWGTNGQLIAECIPTAQAAVDLYYKPPDPPPTLEDDPMWIDVLPDGDTVLVCPAQGGFYVLGSEAISYFEGNGVPKAKDKIIHGVAVKLKNLGTI